MALTKVSYSMLTGAPVNVLDYGADSTGVSNSTTAIQAALDTELPVYIPAGKYLINALTTKGNGQMVSGDGLDTELEIQTDVDGIQIGNENQTLQNLYIHQKSGVASTSSCINVTGYGALRLLHMFLGNTYTGIECNGGGFSAVNTIVENTSGPAIGLSGDQVTEIIGLGVASCEYGVYSSFASGVAPRLRIVDMYTFDCPKESLVLIGQGSVTVADCFFMWGRTHAVTLNTVSNGQFSNINILSTGRDSTPNAQYDGIRLTTCNNNLFTNITVENPLPQSYTRYAINFVDNGSTNNFFTNAIINDIDGLSSISGFFSTGGRFTNVKAKMYNDTTAAGYDTVISSNVNNQLYFIPSATGSIDLSSYASLYCVSLVGNSTLNSYALTPSIGQEITISFIQDATGGRSVAWGASFKVSWVDTGNTSNKVSSITFYWNGTNWIQKSAQTPYV